VDLENSIFIAAPPEAVWDRLTDPARASEVVPVLESVELLDGGMHAGARVRVGVSGLGSRRYAEGKVTSSERPRRLGLSADVPEVKATARIDWEILDAPGGTKVTQRVSIAFRSTLARMAARALVSDAKANEAATEGLAALKRAVEADVAK
jgi:carbon monoxide dehydrogenase subunit G